VTVDTDSELRQLEFTLNGVWDAYKNLYYGQSSGAVGSVYLKPLNEKEEFVMLTHGFHAYFGICKPCPAVEVEEHEEANEGDAGGSRTASGMWHSFHHVTVDTPDEKTCTYRVASSVLMAVSPLVSEVATGSQTTSEISAMFRKETSKQCKIQQSNLAACHIENMGQLVEANEIDLRTSFDRVHVPKMQEIMDGIQKAPDSDETRRRAGPRPGGADSAARPSPMGMGMGGPPPGGGVNPLMGMIMGSDVLKKKLAKEQLNLQNA
jgi:F-actin capping protein, beta subunit